MRRRSVTSGWSARAVLSSAVLLSGVLLSGAACSTTADVVTPGAPDSARGTVVITAGNPTGVYFAWSRQLARQLKVTNPRLKVVVQGSDGSLANLQRLRDGSADLGLTTVDATEPPIRTGLSPAAVDAGVEAQETSVQLRALGRIYDDYVQIVVRADSPLRTVADLAGRRVAVNTAGSGTALVARRVLEAAGITVVERNLGVENGTKASRRRRSRPRRSAPACACCHSATWPGPCAPRTAGCTGRPRSRRAATSEPRRWPRLPPRTCWWQGRTPIRRW
jgi:TRAP transporter TAXI family solute receptor